MSKKCCEEKHIGLILIGEREEKNYIIMSDFSAFMFDCTYIVEETIFVAIVYKLLEQQTYSNLILKTAVNIMVNKK